MSNEVGIFDLDSDKEFFRSLQRISSKLRSQKVKETTVLLYLIMGANHLRDWIAPGFDWKSAHPVTPEQEFGVALFEFSDFKVINNVCNRSKHMGRIRYTPEARYGAMIDDWPDFDAVANIDNGPPTGYVVDGRDLLDIIDNVLNYYDSNWYQREPTLK